MVFSQKLRKMREKAGWSQEALAERLNVTRQAVVKWEAGKGFPDINNLQLLAKLFNTSVDELINYQKNGVLTAIVEPISLDDYQQKADKKHSTFDLVVLDKFADADKIESIWREPKLNWWQELVDIISFGMVRASMFGELVKQVKNHPYLVQKKDRQWIVDVYDDRIESRELAGTKFNKRSLVIKPYTYRKSGVVLLEK